MIAYNGSALFNSSRIFIFLLISFISVSCNKPKITSKLSSRDSIMDSYFQILDSLPFEDTLSLNFQLLKAYHRNDTAILREVYLNKVNLSHSVQRVPKRHRCDTNGLVNVMDCDEGYRFSYSASFCDKFAIVTVQKVSGGMALQSVLYQIDSKTQGCIIVKQGNKKFDDKAWNSFSEELGFADFWGLKEENGDIGLDGSSLNIFGLRKSKASHNIEYKEIRRWSPEKTAIGQVFRYILDLSDIEAECFHYE